MLVMVTMYKAAVRCHRLPSHHCAWRRYRPPTPPARQPVVAREVGDRQDRRRSNRLPVAATVIEAVLARNDRCCGNSSNGCSRWHHFCAAAGRSCKADVSHEPDRQRAMDMRHAPFVAVVVVADSAGAVCSPVPTVCGCAEPAVFVMPKVPVKNGKYAGNIYAAALTAIAPVTSALAFPVGPIAPFAPATGGASMVNPVSSVNPASLDVNRRAPGVVPAWRGAPVGYAGHAHRVGRFVAVAVKCD